MINILNTINETMHLNRLQGMTYENVKNSFFANYMAALVLLRVQDLKGLMIINDPSHSRLSRFSDNMSDVNFWGRALFYPNEHEIKTRLVGYESALGTNAAKIVDSRIQQIMKVPLTSPEQINWDIVISSLILLKQRFALNSSYFNNIVNVLYKWNSISDSGKKRALNQVFMYLMQSDPKSKILDRIRTLSNSTMVNGINRAAQRIIGFKKLTEDGEGGDGGDSGTSVGSIAGTNAIVNGKGTGTCTTDNMLAGLYKLKKKAPHQVTKKSGVVFKDGKIIRRKVKTFVARKFKAPDFLRAAKKLKDQE